MTEILNRPDDCPGEMRKCETCKECVSRTECLEDLHIKVLMLSRSLLEQQNKAVEEMEFEKSLAEAEIEKNLREEVGRTRGRVLTPGAFLGGETVIRYDDPGIMERYAKAFVSFVGILKGVLLESMILEEENPAQDVRGRAARPPKDADAKMTPLDSIITDETVVSLFEIYITRACYMS